MKQIELTKKQLHILIIVLAIVAFFVVSLILAILCGNIYRNSNEYKQEKFFYDVSTYFTDEMRHGESFSQIRTALLEGDISSLVIPNENDDGEMIETWYFTYDGHLCKITAPAGEAMTADMGQPVMDLENAYFSMINTDLLEINMIDKSGQSFMMNFHLAGKGGDDGE